MLPRLTPEDEECTWLVRLRGTEQVCQGQETWCPHLPSMGELAPGAGPGPGPGKPVSLRDEIWAVRLFAEVKQILHLTWSAWKLTLWSPSLRSLHSFHNWFRTQKTRRTLLLGPKTSTTFRSPFAQLWWKMNKQSKQSYMKGTSCPRPTKHTFRT